MLAYCDIMTLEKALKNNSWKLYSLNLEHKCNHRHVFTENMGAVIVVILSLINLWSSIVIDIFEKQPNNHWKVYFVFPAGSLDSDLYGGGGQQQDAISNG